MERPEKSKQGGKGFSFPASLRGFKSFKQTDHPTELQSPITDPGPSQAPKMSSLCCVIEDEDIVFPVDVPPQARVSALKKEIQRERAMGTLRGVDPHTLELWKLRDINAIAAEPANTLLGRIRSMGALSEFAEKLEPMASLSKIFPTQLPMDRIQIVVKITGKRKREDSDDVSEIIGRWQSKRLKSQLPSIEELKALVDQPLSDDEKIPLGNDRFVALINTTTPAAWCSRTNVGALFRSEGDLGYSALDKIFFIVSEPPPQSGTEASFHSFWDSNVRSILELLIPVGKSIRDSSRHTATGSLRPDYGFLLRNLCTFRGEEKSPDSNEDPKAELSNKLAWAYDPAPYVLGYYAIGTSFTLVAITPPSGPGALPVVHDIATADLSLTRDRIKNICRLINIAGLLQQLADLVRPLDAEFEVLQRDRNTVEVAGHSVIKTCTGPDKVQRVGRLMSTYLLLTDKKVPHTDSLLHHYGTTVVLRPRGISKPPRTEDELVAALVCVLEMLEVLHQEPPVFHRDLRWPNVVRRLDDQHKWFVIDWEDASAAPTQAQFHFNRETHSPKVFSNGHGAEVDMWGVGTLISQCGSLYISEELRNLGERMRSATPPSAQKALNEVRKYSYTTGSNEPSSSKIQ